jgi:cytochrome c553
MNTRWLIIGLATLSMLVTTAQGAGNPQAGQAKAAMCVACHGPDGNSVNAEWPKLAGQHEHYLQRQLTLFKSGQRENPIMAGMAATLDEQDIANIAAYYAAQRGKPGLTDQSLYALGRQLYLAGNERSGVPACMACHGPTGRGNPTSGYPALGGQHATYLNSTLKAFRLGAIWGRDTTANNVMSLVANEMTDAEIEAVSAYIQGLH